MAVTAQESNTALMEREAAAAKRRRQQRDWLGRIGMHAVLIALSVMALVPVLWMISSSLKMPTEIFVTPMQWIPSTFRWENYPTAFSRAPLWLPRGCAAHRGRR